MSDLTSTGSNGSESDLDSDECNQASTSIILPETLIAEKKESNKHSSDTKKGARARQRKTSMNCLPSSPKTLVEAHTTKTLAWFRAKLSVVHSLI